MNDGLEPPSLLPTPLTLTDLVSSPSYSKLLHPRENLQGSTKVLKAMIILQDKSYIKMDIYRQTKSTKRRNSQLFTSGRKRYSGPCHAPRNLPITNFSIKRLNDLHFI